MADKGLFSRLKRLFSTDVLIRNVGGDQLKVMDVNNIQMTGDLGVLYCIQIMMQWTWMLL